MSTKKKTNLFVSIFGFYCLGLVFSRLSTQFFNTNMDDFGNFKTPLFWLGPMACILFGLAIGGLLLILNNPKNRARLLLYSTMGGLILYCITISTIQFNDWYHLRYTSNIESNLNFINSNSSNPEQEQLASKMLTDRYKNPNDLRLDQISFSQYDSLVNRVTTKVYDIGFIYYREHKSGRYKSRCLIVGGQGKLQFFDRSLSDSEEHSLDSSSSAGLREGLQTILDDSAKLSLDSASKEVIRNKIKSKVIVLDTPAKPR